MTGEKNIGLEFGVKFGTDLMNLKYLEIGSFCLCPSNQQFRSTIENLVNLEECKLAFNKSCDVDPHCT